MRSSRSAGPISASSPATPELAGAPGIVGRWVMATRPATLTAAAAPILVGTACAWAVGGFRLGPALAALAGAFLLQVGANLANDLFDYQKGADTPDRLGPTRVVQSGLLSPAAVRAGMALTFALALLVGVYLVWVAGPVIVVIGLVSIAAAVAYTGGPYPLAYNTLGDIAVLIFFGFVAVGGTAFVQAGFVPTLAWIAAIPVGALTTAILVVNNVRDIETDAAAGKRTLAVRLGRRGAVAEYALLLGVGYAVPMGLVLTGRLSAWALLPLASAPLALVLYRRVRDQRGRALNPALGGTARLLFLFGALFALGIVLGS
jgi:1,4-dihydroxy-2-naphthoate polyprenyltransferase